MSMLLSDLVADHKAALMDSAALFTAAADADFIRHLTAALPDVSRLAPRTVQASITVAAGVRLYAAPADLVDVKYPLWGDAERARIPRHDPDYPRHLPKLRKAEDDGVLSLALDPPPTACQISVCGADYPYRYYALHVLSDTAGATTLPEGKRDVLLLRALAEAMKELMNRNVHKPVQLRDGLQSGPKNGTPAAIYEALMEEWRRLS
jgi:hypothetical protein